jgi:hypothetical protein
MYDIGGRREYNEARDKLEELREGIIEVLGEIKAGAGVQKGIDEVRNNIGRYYTRGDGYNSTNRIEEYKNEITIKYIEAKMDEEKAGEGYKGLKGEKGAKQKEIERNGWILRESGKDITDYENRVLKIKALEVERAREREKIAEEENKEAERAYKEVQDNYVGKLREVKEASRSMEEAKKEYEKDFPHKSSLELQM